MNRILLSKTFNEGTVSVHLVQIIDGTHAGLFDIIIGRQSGELRPCTLFFDRETAVEYFHLIQLGKPS